MESLDSSISSFTTPKKSHLLSLSSSSFTPMVATPEPRQIRILKPDIGVSGSWSGSSVLDYGVSGKSKEFQICSLHLPQKYEMLCGFFDAMVSSIRLLRLNRLPSTLTRLCRSIESLTDRRFTSHHLAQLKHIVPEVIVVKKIRVQDRETNCMEEDLLVSLKLDAVQTDEDMNVGGGFSELKEIFRSRLTDYFRTNNEEDDVPDGELPQLFYQPKQEPEPSMCRTPTQRAVLHTAPSFKRHFSSRALGAPVFKSSQAEPSSHLIETPIKEAISTETKDGSTCSIIEITAAPLQLTSTPAKLALTPSKLVSTPSILASTPAKLASTPTRLMAATPGLLPPKRPLITPDRDCSSDIPNKLAKRRALRFEQSSDEIEDQLTQVGVEETSCPAQTSFASEDEVLSHDRLQLLKEKEQNIVEEQDPVISQAKRRQQLMAGVPKLFDMTLLLFQSIQLSVVTREELIYKLITGHLAILDRKEIEEQLELLQEVAPEYISELQSLSGDTLLRVNKSTCPESIRMKLFEAK